jgi:hypothetical protein
MSGDELPEDEAPGGEVPEGAAVLPEIPAGLQVHPLLLAVLHATVFLTGSDAEVVNADAADEAWQQMAGYLQRLEGAELRRAQEDMRCLTAYARQQGWPRPDVRFLKEFLSDVGVGPQGDE